MSHRKQDLKEWSHILLRSQTEHNIWTETVCTDLAAWKLFMSSGNSLGDRTENVRKQELQDLDTKSEEIPQALDTFCLHLQWLVFREVFDIFLIWRTWLLLGISNVFCFPDNQCMFQCS